ncbi:porin family protein [Nonlabens xiamenensis]|uniref:porin family protein n=1 Tax=Nonlabens xiamenensis TaxID=2341043 RepID=UPI000F60B3F1|nr:porin family protein [Nonlabens xiamenensis]
MKKLLIIALLAVGGLATAQTESGFGITAGPNYGSTGDLKQDGRTILDDPDDKLGYHVGLFVKADLGRVYFRPELLYTNLNSEYDGRAFDVHKLDAPILVGIDVVGPLHVFAGPSLQYIIETELENVEVDDVMEDFTVGAQFGVGVNFGNLGIDLRYERGFTENEVSFIDENVLSSDRFSIDTRPEQIILGISLKL